MNLKYVVDYTYAVSCWQEYKEKLENYGFQFSGKEENGQCFFKAVNCVQCLYCTVEFASAEDLVEFIKMWDDVLFHEGNKILINSRS